jgi:hypothetical protein
MTAHRLEFGYHPGPLHLQAGPVTIEALPTLAKAVADAEADDGIVDGWLYAPPQKVRLLGGGVRTLPYPTRIFGLPRTHVIEHATAESDDQLIFHLWALSFFTGMRLTATEAGFVDATPLKPGKLVDFVPLGKSLVRAVEMADAFWAINRSEPQRSRLFAAAVHTFFIAQNPRHLQFEKFMLLYMAFDACFTLAKSMHPTKARITHGERVSWMCSLFKVVTPAWADPTAAVGPAVATLRNATIHEALFMSEPLGFALHGVGTEQNLTLEMEALICRFLVALLGGDQADYVRSPVNTRQRHGLVLT